MTVSSRRITLRDLEEQMQEVVETLHRPEDHEAKLDAISMLVEIKKARALEYIANTLRDGVKIIQ